MNAYRTPTAPRPTNEPWLDWYANQMLRDTDDVRRDVPAVCDYPGRDAGEDEGRGTGRFLAKRAAAAVGVALAAGVATPALVQVISNSQAPEQAADYQLAADSQTAKQAPSAAKQQAPGATSIPGLDGTYSANQIDAMREVVHNAEAPGYVSQFSAKALRATTLPAQTSKQLDKNAVAAQM